MVFMSTCLWFDTEAEDAAKFYTSIFKNGKIGKVTRYGKAGLEIHGRPEGSVMTVDFEILGQKFIALNGGPMFQFNESISLTVNCDTQEEIDYYWKRLTENGEEGPCGWLKDRYGVSWQIVPKLFDELANDPQKFDRAMDAMFKMKKMDIEALKRAAV